MKSEALDAFATQSIRPGALDAAVADQREADQSKAGSNMTEKKDTYHSEPSRPTLNRLNTPFGQRTDGTESAAKVVEEVAQVVEGVMEGVKTVVHEAFVWTEKKAEELAHSEDHTGPYDSPATAAGGISDLDVIATGVLPATIPVQEDGNDKEPDDDQKSGGRDSRL